MAVEVVVQRKVVQLSWNTGEVRGGTVSVRVADVEKRNVQNKGKVNLTFPNDFTGPVEVSIVGSRSGTDTGTINVT